MNIFSIFLEIIKKKLFRRSRKNAYKYFFTINVNRLKRYLELEYKLEEKTIIINPNTSGYVCRKMSKWKGLILSEYTENINKKKKKVEKKKKSVEIIYRLIDFSYSQKVMVTIPIGFFFIELSNKCFSAIMSKSYIYDGKDHLEANLVF